MNKEPSFIGRQSDLEKLARLLRKPSASLVVVQGRRRIGKSRLIEEFAKKYTFYQFSALPPTAHTTAQSQRDEFARQLSLQTHLPEVTSDDWSKLFLLLNEKIARGRVVVLFDEISWMGSKDSDFLGKVKNAWDLYFKKNPQLIFVLCGSASAWIEKNILSNTGFFGRPSLKLVVEELPLTDCAKFWGKQGEKISAYEKFKLLSVTGGVPRYLEEIRPHVPAEENIKSLCFSKGGVLMDEFEHIFSDLFSNRSATYKKIVRTLVNGPKELKEICKELKIGQTGFISEYLDDLIKSGFVSRDHTWHIRSEESSKLSTFRLSDNYLRFYLKYIEKNRSKIDANEFTLRALSGLPGWEAIMGFQFENLVLNNRQWIKQKLGIKPDEITFNNPFFQRKTTQTRGCQIDYLIQTRFGALYACEIKFLKSEIQPAIIREVQQKLERLSYPKGFSIRPVLIHVNGVHPDVLDSGYFSEIVDFGEILSSR